MRTTIAALLGVLAIGLAGCSGGTEPSPPPSASEPLTTSSPTTDAVPTTEAPPPATESPTEANPTELPLEAMEDTEAGAEAFALHYIDLINLTGKQPQTGLLEPLGADGCKSCANHEESVAYSEEHGLRVEEETFQVGESVTLFNPGERTATVRVDVTQPDLEVLNEEGDVAEEVPGLEAVLVFDLAYEGGWTIREITVDQAG